MALELKKKTGLHFLGFGVIRVFHSPGVRVGWHFCQKDMRTGLCSFLALEWCLDGGDLGHGRGAVATWGVAEQSKGKIKKFML